MRITTIVCPISPRFLVRLSLIFIVTEQFFSDVAGFILDCKPLSSETLEGFYDFVINSYGYADVCPFVIKGPSCQTSQDYADGYTVPTGENLYIACDPYKRESKCIIDCPVHRYFTVSPFASLTIENMVLSSANSSAVSVDMRGQLTVFDSIFENNVASGMRNGGAIFASENSILHIRFCKFQNNVAEKGGAIQSLGQTIVVQSAFRTNFASITVSLLGCILGQFLLRNQILKLELSTCHQGGAIVAANIGATLDIDNSTFEFNEAANGGAVFVDEGSSSSISHTTFTSNVAFAGGAIENFGSLDLVASEFIDNHAGSGGAINTGPGSSSNLRRNTFMNNEADINGPAVYDRYRSTIHERDNTACGNTVSSKDQECDGVLIRVSLRTVRCRSFANECIAPTEAPSDAPSMAPSQLHSHTSNKSPSAIPSLTSSFQPTLSSSNNSLKPSSSAPSSSSSKFPIYMLTSSLQPSVNPTYAQTDSQAPSSSPNPSDTPSSPVQSQVSTQSRQPSDLPGFLSSTLPIASSQPSASAIFPPFEPSHKPNGISSLSVPPSTSNASSQSLSLTESTGPSSTPSQLSSNQSSKKEFPTNVPSILPS